MSALVSGISAWESADSTKYFELPPRPSSLQPPAATDFANVSSVQNVPSEVGESANAERSPMASQRTPGNGVSVRAVSLEHFAVDLHSIKNPGATLTTVYADKVFGARAGRASRTSSREVLSAASPASDNGSQALCDAGEAARALPPRHVVGNAHAGRRFRAEGSPPGFPSNSSRSHAYPQDGYVPRPSLPESMANSKAGYAAIVEYEEGDNPMNELIRLGGGHGLDIIVEEIDPGSKAYRAGVRPGFALSAINGRMDVSRLPGWQVRLLLDSPITLGFHASPIRCTEIRLRPEGGDRLLGIPSQKPVVGPQDNVWLAEEVVFKTSAAPLWMNSVSLDVDGESQSALYELRRQEAHKLVGSAVRGARHHVSPGSNPLEARKLAGDGAVFSASSTSWPVRAADQAIPVPICATSCATDCIDDDFEIEFDTGRRRGLLVHTPRAERETFETMSRFAAARSTRRADASIVTLSGATTGIKIGQTPQPKKIHSGSSNVKSFSSPDPPVSPPSSSRNGGERVQGSHFAPVVHTDLSPPAPWTSQTSGVARVFPSENDPAPPVKKHMFMSPSQASFSTAMPREHFIYGPLHRGHTGTADDDERDEHIIF